MWGARPVPSSAQLSSGVWDYSWSIQRDTEVEEEGLLVSSTSQSLHHLSVYLPFPMTWKLDQTVFGSKAYSERKRFYFNFLHFLCLQRDIMDRNWGISSKALSLKYSLAEVLKFSIHLSPQHLREFRLPKITHGVWRFIRMYSTDKGVFTINQTSISNWSSSGVTVFFLSRSSLTTRS